jgi:predicted phage baseplate assembly protein
LKCVGLQHKFSAGDSFALTGPTGGAAAETLAHAEGRAVEVMERPNRAVTLADYKSFARQTPGVRLARVAARASRHPAFPCFQAPGIIAVLILPYLPSDRPRPSAGLQKTVGAYLARHRVIGTRVEVFGPTYLEVAVRAQVQACRGTSAAGLLSRLTAALNRFFHPLVGGPDGQGWPFGRDVYRSEVLQVMDETEGVDHVVSLELIAAGGEPQCGNICLGPTGLVAAGHHQIEIVSR